MSKEEGLALLRVALRAGLPIRRIAEEVGRSPTTIRRWIHEDKELLRERLALEAEAFVKIRQSDAWRAQAWILSRLHPLDYNELESIKRALRETASELDMPLDQLAARIAEKEEGRGGA